MPQLAQRVGRAKPSAIMLIAEKAKQLKAAGRDIISFSIGVPNFLPGEHVYAAAREALNHDSGQYGSNRGADALLDAFLAHIEKLGFTGYGRTNLSIGIGAKQVLYNLAEALLDEGDEIYLRLAVLDQLPRHRRDRRRAHQRAAVRAGAELQAHPGTAGCGAGAQAEGIPVQQPVQPHRHGLHARGDRRAGRGAGQASGHLDHHRRHLQHHGVRRHRLPQFRVRAASAARAVDLRRLGVQDLRHARLARRPARRPGGRWPGR